jgi:ATP-dependent exoDNAse (exonuclease V) beta subunit
MTSSVVADQPQRQQVLDTNLSFIVQAPAGSGKTELLTQRFLALLTKVNTPEEIVAITFTKKAANEMRNRILQALHLATKPQPSDSHAQQRWQLARAALQHSEEAGWQLLKNPNRLRITTIDALCSSIVRQMPVLSHLGTLPRICDNPDQLYERAVQQLMQHLELDHEFSESVRQVFQHYHNDIETIMQMFKTMLSRREQWVKYAVAENTPELKIKLQETLSTIIQENLTQLATAAQQHSIFSQLLPLLSYASSNLAREQQNCFVIDAWPATEASALAQWQHIAHLLLTEQNTWRKRLDKNCGFLPEKEFVTTAEKQQAKELKAQMTSLLQQLESEPAILALLTTIKLLPAADYYQQNWHKVSHLLRVLHLLLAELRLQFNARGEVDFIEIATSAVNALGQYDQPSDLLLSLDSRIQHLLIDEFQDTSDLQYQLIQKLTSGWWPGDGRTLFLVGDPMQSIYRFRQAEVGLFLKAAREGIGNVALTFIQLNSNFRSAPSIVEWVNQTFAQVFPTINDIPTGAIQYAPCQASRNSAAIDVITAVQYHACTDDKHANESVLQLINQALMTPSVKSTAILVRNKKHATELLPLLRAARISYQAVDIERLTLRPIIQDLLALTKALLFLADRTAWLAVLRAPWCGLSLADLLYISQLQTSGCLWPAILAAKTQSEISNDGQQRLQRVIPILELALNERARLPLRQWIEHTWVALGGPACLERAIDMLDCQSYFNLLEQFDPNGLAITDFLVFEHTLAKAYSTATVASDSKLHIMTIHKSKGLEFDVVILPALHDAASDSNTDALVWMDQPRSQHSNDLLLATRKASGEESDKMYGFIKQLDKTKNYYEIARVLYVASTRAREQLHLVFQQPDDTKIAEKSFLHLLWEVIAPQLTKTPIAETISEAEPILAAPTLSRLTAQWQLPTAIQLPSLNLATDNNAITFQWQPNQERRIGIVIHQMLRTIGERGIKAWQTLSHPQQQQQIHSLCINAGLLSDQLNFAAQQIQKAINNIVHDTRGTWLLMHLNNSQARYEYNISSWEQEEIKQWVLDVTFIDDLGTRWIIDYKTATPTDTDEALASFLQTQQENYKQQLENYAAQLMKIDPRPTRLGLYLPLVPEWIEWEYQVD